MMRYVVEVTETALAAIAMHARYIAVDAAAEGNAARWLNQLWDAIDSLERAPHRASLAEENDYVDIEVRRLIVGSHLVLFTVDDARRRVIIVGVRHGHARPRATGLS